MKQKPRDEGICGNFSTLKLICTSKLTFDQDNPQARIPQALHTATTKTSPKCTTLKFQFAVTRNSPPCDNKYLGLKDFSYHTFAHAPVCCFVFVSMLILEEWEARTFQVLCNRASYLGFTAFWMLLEFSCALRNRTPKAERVVLKPTLSAIAHRDRANLK